jgi:hypothetical protein
VRVALAAGQEAVARWRELHAARAALEELIAAATEPVSATAMK